MLNISEILENIENTLEQIILKKNIKLSNFKDKIEKKYQKKFFMSGSGSTFFTFINDEELNIVEHINKKVSKKYFTKITQFI